MRSRNKTYLYNNVEVKLTGRYTTKKRTRQRQEIDVYVFEVEPVDTFDGAWKKWANDEDLLDINTMEN